MLSTPGARLIALDTETTGFGNAALLSFYAVEFDLETGKTSKELELAFNPGFHIPEKITEITGITDEMVKDLPRITEDHLREIGKFIYGAEVWIHNKSFDEGILNRHMEIFDLKDIGDMCDVKCSMRLARELGHKKCSLDALCEKYNISLSERSVHGAKVDAMLLKELVVRMHRLHTYMQSFESGKVISH
jgi:DNA polymerase III subunit epsilon